MPRVQSVEELSVAIEHYAGLLEHYPDLRPTVARLRAAQAIITRDDLAVWEQNVAVTANVMVSEVAEQANWPNYIISKAAANVSRAAEGLLDRG